jgi:hypothetical protein
MIAVLILLQMAMDTTANVRFGSILLKNSVLRRVILSLWFQCEICIPADAGF